MNDPQHSSPHGTPKVPSRIVEGLTAAIAEPERFETAYINLSVGGGVRGESYEFQHHVDATGRTATQMHDELNDRHHEARQLEPDRERFTSLARAIDIEALMRAEEPPPRFPPDSVVGRLEVSDGEQTARFTFLADPEQAERAKSIASPPLRQAVDAVYESAANVLGVEELRP